MQISLSIQSSYILLNLNDIHFKSLEGNLAEIIKIKNNNLSEYKMTEAHCEAHIH